LHVLDVEKPAVNLRGSCDLTLLAKIDVRERAGDGIGSLRFQLNKARFSLFRAVISKLVFTWVFAEHLNTSLKTS
jgi:hypothetical protein